MIDIFRFTKSKTRQKIVSLFLENPDKDFYLRDIARHVGSSAANVRRELLILVESGLFRIYRKGRLVYYAINTDSPFYLILMKQPSSHDILTIAFSWVSSRKPVTIPDFLYCPTRDVFQARLEKELNQWENQIGQEAYLLTAVAGEIGNNSYDHNLGSWPDVPGTYFASDGKKKIVMIGDRGQGILKTIKFVKPKINSYKEALRVAFTEILSGRAGERRGNGLKFVRQTIIEKKWNLEFYSGDSLVTINHQLSIKRSGGSIKGCLAVVRY